MDNPPALRWGSSYVNGLFFFLPKKLYPGIKPRPIGNEFADEIASKFASAYYPASGWGYSPVAEAYINFSFPGVLVIPVLWAIGLDLLERLRWRGLVGLICVTVLLPQTLNANRIDFLWTYTESLFAIGAALSACIAARFVANSRASNRRPKAMSRGQSL